MLPDTKNIGVATGASPIEKFWLENLRREYQPFTNRVTFDWLNELSLEEMLKRVATLPPRFAIYYNHVHVDARGVPQENDRALSRLREVASAPIFSFIDSNFGKGIVGGPLVSTQRLAHLTRRLLVFDRVMKGCRAQKRRVTYARFNAENLHERNRMIDVGARLLVIAALHTMLARCELKRPDQQAHVVSLVHGRTVPLIL